MSVPPSDAPSSWEIEYTDEFKAKLRKLTKRDPVLRDAFQKKFRAIVENPTTMGKRSVKPRDLRHDHVKSHWVIFWRVEGTRITFLDCGHHDEFFR